MTPIEFIKKWKPVSLTERAAAHTHFLDLCKLFEHDDPVSADPTGEWFTFEKGATKTGGGEGFADVWKKNYFAWEYKKPDLIAATRRPQTIKNTRSKPPISSLGLYIQMRWDELHRQSGRSSTQADERIVRRISCSNQPIHHFRD